MEPLSPSPSLTKDEVERGLSYVILDGLSTHAFVTLTGGIFLVAFALELGASNIVIGLLAAIPPLAELVQIPAIGLIERIRNRRLISVVASVFSRCVWVLIALIPFLVSPETGIACLVLLLVLYSCISSVKHCSWKSWMRDLIPDEILGMFFSRRLALSFALGAALSLCAGFFLDFWQNGGGRSALTGYSAIFLSGTLIGTAGTWYVVSRRGQYTTNSSRPSASYFSSSNRNTRRRINKSVSTYRMSCLSGCSASSSQKWSITSLGAQCLRAAEWSGTCDFHQPTASAGGPCHASAA
jgi:hypothetical protein